MADPLALFKQVRGRIFILEASDDPEVLAHWQQHFRQGQVVKTKVIGIDAEKGKLDLSIKVLLSNSWCCVCVCRCVCACS